MLVNMICMDQACWCGQALCTVAENLFHIFELTSVILQRFCRLTILDHAHLYKGVVRPDFLIADDNARLHRSAALSNMPESEEINPMQWPEYSPDLNSTEHASEALGTCVSQ